MNVSTPQAMKTFIDQQVRELIHKDRQRLELRKLLLQGGMSAPAGKADEAYFSDLRKKVRSASGLSRVLHAQRDIPGWMRPE